MNPNVRPRTQSPDSSTNSQHNLTVPPSPLDRPSSSNSVPTMAVSNVPLPVQSLSQPLTSSFGFPFYSRDNPNHLSDKLTKMHKPTPKMNKTARDKQWWTKEEDDKLREAVASCGARNWKLISEIADVGKSDVQCLQRWTQVLRPGLKKGTWSKEEDRKLIELVDTHKTTSHTEPFKESIPWKKIEKDMGGRTAKQCRERWKLSLDPTINKSLWTAEEDRQLLELQKELGNSWSQIKDILGTNRTENSVKLRFKCLKKREEKFKRNLERMRQQNLPFEEQKPPQQPFKKLRTNSMPAFPLREVRNPPNNLIQSASTQNMSNFSDVFVNDRFAQQTQTINYATIENQVQVQRQQQTRQDAQQREDHLPFNVNLESLFHAVELAPIKTEECGRVGFTGVRDDSKNSSDCDGDKTPVVPYDDSHGSSGSFSRQDSWKSIEFDEVLQILSDGTP